MIHNPKTLLETQMQDWDHKWYIAKPMQLHNLRWLIHRFRDAWAVFRGKAVAVEWR